MIAALQSWAISVCAAAVVGAVAHIALPEGSLQKVLKLTIQVFFLCCLLSPLVLKSPELEWDLALSASEAQSQAEQEARQMQETFQRQVEEQFLQAVAPDIQNALAENGISGTEISVNIHTDGSGSVFINELQITVPAAYSLHEKKIREIVETQTGLTPVITWTGRMEQSEQ